MIAEREPLFHHMPAHRILYVGGDLTLFKSLGESLAECQLVRCTNGSLASSLIGSEIGYSLLLLDEQLADASGRELALLARQVRHRERTPIIILSPSEAGCEVGGVFLEKPDDLKVLVSDIERLLAAPQ